MRAYRNKKETDAYNTPNKKRPMCNGHGEWLVFMTESIMLLLVINLKITPSISGIIVHRNSFYEKCFTRLAYYFAVSKKNVWRLPEFCRTFSAIKIQFYVMLVLSLQSYWVAIITKSKGLNDTTLRWRMQCVFREHFYIFWKIL